uniref:Uncharacterized protein n=1 Tax=Anguilla anguilla TaxID=7936 RepID=A0A0E9WAG1_ANGAN
MLTRKPRACDKYSFVQTVSHAINRWLLICSRRGYLKAPSYLFQVLLNARLLALSFFSI